MGSYINAKYAKYRQIKDSYIFIYNIRYAPPYNSNIGYTFYLYELWFFCAIVFTNFKFTVTLVQRPCKPFSNADTPI